MKKIVVLLTACLLLFGASISAAAQIAAPAAVQSYDDLDFRVNTKKTATAYMGDVLDSLEGITVSEQEKAYIRYEFDGQSVLYYTKPALIDRQYEYDGEYQRLTVTVMQDSYEPAKHDTVVEWIPTTATVGDVTANFVPAPDLGEGYYRAVLEDCSWFEDMTAMVEYRAEFKVSAEALNEYVNYAYEQALLLHDEFTSLEERRAAYNAALQAYERNRDEWAKYEEDSDRYELYLAKKAKYQDYLAYQAYLVRLEEYRVAHDAYLANQREWAYYEQQNTKYQQYLNYKNVEYPKLTAQYQNQMSTVQQQLALLALLEKKDPNTGISFIEMMVDDRIATMIAEKRTLVSSVVGDGPVDAVIESTNALQYFCKTYQNLPTDQEKYTFYIKEYNKVKVVQGGTVSDGLVKHLRQLYTNIKTLYETKAIYVELQKEYPEHIATLVRLLGSLYVQRCVFDDAVTLNPNEIVDTRGNQKASALVHASVRPASDTNKATPLSAWPSAPADPETYEVRVQPVKPAQTLEDATYPSKPTFTTVSHEDELDDYMEDPGHMDPPAPPEGERLSHPGSEPTLNWEENQQGLHDAYLAGSVAYRPEFTESQTVSITASNQFAIVLDDAERYYYVYFYADDQSTYLGHSLGVKAGEGASIPDHLLTPEKAPEVQIVYEFVAWVDENGDPLDISCLTKDVYAYASYRTVPRKYNVTWVVGSGTVEQSWEYGQTPSFEGSTDKPADARYEYAFIGWDKQFSPVTGDVTYTAQYERSDRRFSVMFDAGDGTAPIVKVYRYGQSLAEVVSSLSKPYLAPTAQYTYTFKGWSDTDGNLYTNAGDFPTLTSDMTFTAVFDSAVNAYTVTWIVDGVSTMTTWLYGETPSFGENPPHKETDERYYYAFAGWDTDPVPVTGDAAYVANFTSTVRLYRVDFVVEGEAFTLELEYEQMPVFEGTPKKDSDVQYDYTFVGWDNDPVPVRGDAIYVAEFGKIVRKYPVKFVFGSSELITEFEYGTVPKYAGDVPVKPDDAVYSYKFTGWDKELAAVDGSAVTYTACFTAVPLAPAADGENGKLTVLDGGVYELVLNGAQADLSLIFDKVGREQANVLSVHFGNAVLEFPKAQIDAFYLMGNGIASVSLTLTEQDGQVIYKLEMLDSSGAPVPYLVSDVTVKLPYNGAYSADVFRVAEDGTQTKLTAEYKDGYLSFTAMESATFAVREKYTVGKNPTENGVFDAVGEAYGGDVIVIAPDPNEGYHVDEVIVEYGGEQIKLEPENGKYTFIMPNENVQITTTFKVVEGGTVIEVAVGICTALLIVAIGFVIGIVLHRRKNAKI